jgi:hypothetical protein
LVYENSLKLFLKTFLETVSVLKLPPKLLGETAVETALKLLGILARRF